MSDYYEVGRENLERLAHSSVTDAAKRNEALILCFPPKNSRARNAPYR